MTKKRVRRVVLIVMDSLGVGELPDAKEYGDQGANTLQNAARAVGGMALPNLETLGLGELVDLHPSHSVPIKGAYGKMGELSKGKDTTTGHWELAGVLVSEAFPTYPKGFPASLIKEFESRIGRKTLGNKTASGTEIIKELGEEHCRTGSPIVYTSADSVFQIAAHEEIIPLDELYRICKVARELLCGEHAVGRVIARPFVGQAGSFARTHHRHDYSLVPSGETLLDKIKAAGLEVVSVGKIWDIFAGCGISRHLAAGPNSEVMEKTLQGIRDPKFTDGLLFSNLVDFDMLYNHRQDPDGLSKALSEFDHFLPKILSALHDDDVLMITADHGNDPTDNSTDHCREYVPILAYGRCVPAGLHLGVRKSFADCGQTIAELLQAPKLALGESFAKELSA